MKRIVKADEKEITLSELRKNGITELIFEDKNNWFITYEIQRLDYAMEYCQSTGRGEICGVTVDTLKKCEKHLEFFDDGIKNMEELSKYNSEQPTFSRDTVEYIKLIKKD